MIYIYFIIPVVPARGGAEVALGIYYKTFLIYRTCMRRAPARPVRACILRKWCPVSHVTFEAPLRTSHFSLQSSHSTLHTSHWSLRTPHFTSHCTLKTPHFTLHSPHFKLLTSSPAATTLHGKMQGFVLRLPPQNKAQATFMQPLQYVSQHHVANLRLSTHMATPDDNNHAAIPMRSATTDSRNA